MKERKNGLLFNSLAFRKTHIATGELKCCDCCCSDGTLPSFGMVESRRVPTAINSYRCLHSNVFFLGRSPITSCDLKFAANYFRSSFAVSDSAPLVVRLFRQVCRKPWQQYISPCPRRTARNPRQQMTMASRRTSNECWFCLLEASHSGMISSSKPYSFHLT